MRRRRLHLLALPPLLLGVYLWLESDGAGSLTRGNVGRVQPGMSLNDVTAILGPPMYVMYYADQVTPGNAHWETVTVIADVDFDRSGAVYNTRYERKSAILVRGWWRRTFGTRPPF